MILVDFSHIAMHKYFAIATGNKVDFEELRYEVIDSLRRINSAFKRDYGKLIICCDGKNSWRKDIFPFYKANRKKDRKKSKINWEILIKDINEVRDDLKEYFNWPTIHLDRTEADDIIATLSYASPENHIVISSDKDFVQLEIVKDNIRIHDFFNDKNINVDDPERHLFNHIIKGDGGDGIPNIFSDDDTFLDDNKRQKSVRMKMLDEWYEKKKDLGLSYFISETDQINKYNRNRKIIDLRKIPKSITKSILEEYSNEKDKNNDVSKYFLGRNLGNLYEKVGELTN
jgi:hypothetical protein